MNDNNSKLDLMIKEARDAWGRAYGKIDTSGGPDLSRQPKSESPKPWEQFFPSSEEPTKFYDGQPAPQFLKTGRRL